MYTSRAKFDIIHFKKFIHFELSQTSGETDWTCMIRAQIMLSSDSSPFNYNLFNDGVISL